ncbi:glycosyltransferase family 4 protein [Tichowtungia aerotolerans]|uniref:Glycosyltransferase n=1 Tax=Tichowtungia aerotolerans TaxID=2697043 RepID=A0A6P1MGS6_9BACT|nr:glycosyltransferase family 4 protein [Tichowtungia aerotolerans]QHI70285.1 glycosyltransferase [Tichowtungia aerotolerans]
MPEIRTLNLIYSLPDPPLNGYDLRHLNLMKNLSDRVDQTVLCRIMAPLTPEQKGLLESLPYNVRTVLIPRPTLIQKICKGVRFLFSRFPVMAGGWYYCEMEQALRELLDEKEFDFIVLEGIWNAVYRPVIRQAKAQTVLNLYDLEEGLLQRQADVLPFGLKKWIYSNGAKRMAALEKTLPREADLIWTVSEKERQELLAHSPDLPAFLAPGGVDCDAIHPLPPPDKNGKEILFVGSLQYLPNVDGAQFMSTDVMPEVLKRCPDAKLKIVGRGPDERTLKLHNPPSFDVVGEVEELEPWYRNCQLSIVPLRSGGGTRLKILESMAYGRPVVATSIGAEGIDITPGKNILIADTPEELADCVARILNNPDQGRSIAEEGRKLVEECYSWKSIANILYERYARVIEK